MLKISIVCIQNISNLFTNFGLIAKLKMIGINELTMYAYSSIVLMEMHTNRNPSINIRPAVKARFKPEQILPGTLFSYNGPL